jgi:hypothetical protein
LCASPRPKPVMLAIMHPLRLVPKRVKIAKIPSSRNGKLQTLSPRPFTSYPHRSANLLGKSPFFDILLIKL